MMLAHVAAQTNVNLFDPAHIAQPERLYAQLREKGAPVYHTDWNCYLFTGYTHVAAWYKDKRLTHHPASCTLTPPRDDAEAAADARIAAFFRNWLVQQDPPVHTRGRALMSHAFIPAAIERMVPIIREAAQTTMQRFTTAEGEMDAVTWAYNLTNAVICTMIGLPPDDWACLIATAETFSAYVGTPHPDRARTEAVIADARALFAVEMEKRRAQPKPDVLTALMQAREGQESLSDEEITALAAHLLFAGQETTTNSLSVGIYELFRNGQWELLKAEPTLLDNAVEEILRFTAPLQWMTTFIALEDLEIEGKIIPKDSWCWMGIAAANRDPDVFPNPDVLDIRRPNAKQQVAFGTGAHYCLGATLARVELREALSLLLSMNAEMIDAPITWRPNPILRGIERLPLRLG